eukprot:1157112-Pelagomonas_calceolata.AAC.3
MDAANAALQSLCTLQITPTLFYVLAAPNALMGPQSMEPASLLALKLFLPSTFVLAAPRAIVGPPKYPEQVAQAKGMDAANVALQSLCTSPYDSPPPEKASAPSPRSGPPKAAAVPLSPQNYEALTFLSTPHYQGTVGVPLKNSFGKSGSSNELKNV